MKLVRVNDLVLCLEDETKPPKQSKHYFTIGGKQAADFLMECFNKNAAAPVQAQEPVLEMLLNVAMLAYDAMDNTEENEHGLHWQKGNFDALSAAMDELESLPDDQPGYVMGPAAKAAWALRHRAPVQPVAVPDPLYQAMHDFRDDVLSGINGLDNDQINAVLSTFDNYMLDDPAAPAELQGVATRIGVSTCPSDDGKTIAVVGMAVQEGVSFVFYTGNHSISQDASGFVDINFQRLMEK